MTWYRELAIGSPSARGTVVPEDDIPSFMRRAYALGEELYHSYYRFPEEVVEHFRTYRTIRSYKGIYDLPYVILDIDTEADLEPTLRTLRDMSMMYDLWYSGRGFHVYIPNHFRFTPSATLPLEVRATLTKYFPKADTIYDGARLIRAPFSWNKKTKHLKYPLVKAFYTPFTYDPPDAVPPESIVFPIWSSLTDYDMPIKDLSHLVVKAGKPLSLDSIEDTRDDPSRIVTCMQKLYDRGPVLGRRHTDMLRMVSAWQRNGLPTFAIIKLLVDWNKGTMPESEIKGLVSSIKEKGYRYGCSDPVMVEHCDERCIFYKSKSFGSEIITMDDAEKRLAVMARRDVADLEVNIAKALGTDGELTLLPGEVMVIWADTGIGKSALAQNMVVPLTHQRILYITLEMGAELTYRRFVQIKHRMSKEEVMAHYSARDNTLSEGLGHIKIIQTPPTLHQIRRIIGDVTPSVVVIDVLDAISMPTVLDEHTKLTTIINTLKEIATQQACVIIGIHHISKAAALDFDGRPKALTLHSGKGPSAIEQKADVVLGVERLIKMTGGISLDDTPFTMPVEPIQHRKITLLKGRDHPPYEAEMHFDPQLFLFEP